MHFYPQQLDDNDASIVVAVPSTAATVLRANWLLQKTIPVLCLGEANGCQNIFDVMEKVIVGQ
jgi:hypothetical protein